MRFILSVSSYQVVLFNVDDVDVGVRTHVETVTQSPTSAS